MRPPSARRAATAASAAARRSASASPALAATICLEEDGRVLDDAQEHRAGAEQAGGDRSLERLRGAGVGEPRGEHRRREAVIGQRDQNGVEQPGLPRRRRRALHEQERQLGERHVPHQVAGQVASADRDRVGRGGADPGAKPVARAHVVLSVAGADARGDSKSISARGALARQLVLGHASGGRVRELGDRLHVAGHLERCEQGGRVRPDRGQVGIRGGDQEGLDLLLGQLGGHADHRDLEHVGMGGQRLLDLDRRDVLAPPPDHLLDPADEGVGAGRVGRHQVARAQPAIGREHIRGLLGHAPVSLHHGRVSQLELAHLADARRPALVHHAALVDDPERRVLADAPERAVRAGAARPDRAVRRLGHGIAAHDAKAEAGLDLELALLRRRRAGVAQPQRVVRVVGRSGWRIRISSIAPIALNSVAPCRRAESMNPLAEKAGRSARLARAPTEPSIE